MDPMGMIVKSLGIVLESETRPTQPIVASEGLGHYYYGWWLKFGEPVEVGSFSHYTSRVLYVPGG